MTQILVSTKLWNIDAAIKNILIFILFITPSVMFKGTNELFEFPKMIFVYFSATLVIFLYLTNAFFLNKTHRTTIRSALYPAQLFLLSNGVSAVFSISLYTSLAGYYTRFNGGLLSVILFTSLFMVINKTINGKDGRSLIRVAVLGSIPVCLYGIAQHFGYEKGYWIEDSQARIFSSLGQPNWLAAYNLMIFFPALQIGLKDKGRSKNLFFVLSLLNFASFWLTYSLSGVLGFLAGAVYFLKTVDKSIAKKNLNYLIWTAVFIMSLIIIKPGYLKAKALDAIEDIKRNISHSLVVYAEDTLYQKPVVGDTTGIRLIVWEGTLNLILSNPKVFLIGTGPETFPYAFLKFRPEKLNLTSEWDFIFNKPHNYYLELLSNLGILGLGAYVFMLKSFFSSPSKETGLKTAIVSLAVTDFFGWHTVATTLLLFAYGALLNRKEPDDHI